ncbi:MAG: hypothetical protein ACYDAK_13230 [Candidatus Limnocylindrales bacterium]
MIFATLVGNSILDSDPIWLMIVAPSSGGKSTVIAPLAGIPSVHFVDDLSEKALLSGFKGKKETSLLKIIGSGHIAVSDFTSILMKNPISKGEILSMLKLVYDGVVTKYTGLGIIEWAGKIGTICGSTPDIYTHMETGRSMGERFTYYWMEQPTNDEIVKKQEEVNMSSKEISLAMQPFYLGYMEDISRWLDTHGIPELILTKEQKDKVRIAANFCVLGKSTVHTNFKSGRPDAIPNTAGVGRDIKIFNTILHALLCMKAYEEDTLHVNVDDEMIAIVEKCAYSSINRERRKIIEILVERNGMLAASKIGAEVGLGLEKDAVEMYLHPLHAVGIVKKNASRPFQWFIDDEWTRAYVKRVAPGTHDLTHATGIELDGSEEEEAKSDLDTWLEEARQPIENEDLL